MPKFLSYKKVYDYYFQYNCTLAITEKEFIPNVTKNNVPYYCSNNHLITNLTKNDFNNRINQRLDPCAICSMENKKNSREQQIIDKLTTMNAKFVSLNDRRLIYICKCGKKCKSYDNNILKENSMGCGDCTNPFNRPEIQKKIRETNMRKYGVENVMHVPAILNKLRNVSYTKKSYILPNKKQIFLQGYEPRCLDYLLTIFNQNEILSEITSMPEILYEYENKLHRYYPDFYIPSKNSIIEVKSTRTLNLECHKNIAKFNATVKLNYKLYVFVYDEKSLLYIVYYHNNIQIFIIHKKHFIFFYNSIQDYTEYLNSNEEILFLE